MLTALHILSSQILVTAYYAGTLVVPISYMRKLRHEEVIGNLLRMAHV